MKGFLEFRCSNLKNVYIILRFRDCTYWDKIFTNIPRMSTEWSLTFEKYRISDKTDDWGSIMYFTNLGNIMMKEYQQCFLTFLWRPDSFRIVFFSMQWTVSSTMELISMILYRLIVSTRSKINDVSAIATTDISSRSMAKKFTLLLTVIQYNFAMSKSPPAHFFLQ